jgi:hypothetical protein
MASTLDRDGYLILPSLFARDEVETFLGGLEGAFAQDRDGNAMRSGDGSVFGARNLLRLWPPVATIWRRRPLTDLLRCKLGGEYGLVRVLYFDKPPEQSWALPWHKDLVIAVQNNRLPSEVFAKPTSKAGVPHVEAPLELLERMLTVRLHLDEVTAENGPLLVLPGSHHSGKESARADRPAHTILARPGDVLVMRPLLSHCSNKSHPATRRHRRILHLEFAGVPHLADGYRWHDFIPA